MDKSCPRLDEVWLDSAFLRHHHDPNDPWWGGSNAFRPLCSPSWSDSSSSKSSAGPDASSLPSGILCLIGISTTDTAYESHWLASKLLALKVFPEDKAGESWGWKNSVVDAQYEILCGQSR